MALEQLRLPSGVWSYDPDRPLGPAGGFGAVFAGCDEEGRPVAVKRLHIHAEQAGHRELKIAHDLANRTLRHVMPVLDAGQDSESRAGWGSGLAIQQPPWQGAVTRRPTLGSSGHFHSNC